MNILEFMDLDMLDIVNKGPILGTHQSSNNGACGSKLRGKFVPNYNKEDKRMLNLDENSLDDEAKYLMDQVVESNAHTSHDSVEILKVDSPHIVDDLKSE
ncbi:unnamed protein product [Lactuca saligna]|uniref:Uncharacterized protein n=1 Tax=Lactuca saligna TaxID=75948 RepID=A0AA35VMJ0_LACSI|nr:unnamed protein product [Lactuca saligna]